MEIISTSIRGVYCDILKGPNDNIIYDSGWVSNRIVDRCRKLLAGFMKNDPSEGIEGIQYLAVGKGLEKWDTEGAPPPDSSVTELTDPNPFTIDVKNLSLVYLKENDEEVKGPPTNRLQITATLGPDEPPAVASVSSYPLREFGLFGKFGGEPYMIDCIRHPVIHKDVSATLIRVLRLYF
jgi:hypothetical protein